MLIIWLVSPRLNAFATTALDSFSSTTMKTTAELRAKHGTAWRRVDKWVAVVVDHKGVIRKTYQSKQGNGQWKLTMTGPV